MQVKVAVRAPVPNKSKVSVDVKQHSQPAKRLFEQRMQAWCFGLKDHTHFCVVTNSNVGSLFLAVKTLYMQQATI